MSGLRDLKLRIKSVKSTKQITKAMNLVATIKYKKARDKVEHVRLYLEHLVDNISAVKSDDYQNELMLPREVKKSLFVVINSDRGLCGAFNSSIIKKAAGSIEDKDVVFLTIGNKAKEFFQKKKTIVESFSNSDNVEMKYAAQIAHSIIGLYKSGQVDEVVVFYNKFISTIKFEPTVMKLLPLNFEESSSEVSADETAKKSAEQFTYESSPSEILDVFIPKYITAVIYEKLLEASASEQSSRMTAMNNATENATKIINELSMQYNRARQASITNEISEIVGGTEALK